MHLSIHPVNMNKEGKSCRDVIISDRSIQMIVFDLIFYVDYDFVVKFKLPPNLETN